MPVPRLFPSSAMMSGMFVSQVHVHCRNSQSKVRYKISDPNDADVFIAEFRESIRRAISEIVSLLSDGESDVRRAGADALAKLSEQGKRSEERRVGKECW